MRYSYYLFLIFFLLLPCPSAAQTKVLPERLGARIDEAQIMQLKGSLHPLARAQNDLGPADPTIKLPGITMIFRPTAAQKADLEALLAAQQKPTSPNFHKWLTPQQYGDRFGIAPADLAKISAWLEAKGFVIVDTPASRTSFIFSGTAAQVNAAFRTEIHNYQAREQKFFTNNSELSVPSALAGIVAGFRGLDNYRLKPRLRPAEAAANHATHPGTSPTPDFTSSSLGGNFVTPGDFAVIYDLNALYSASIDGTGQTIAIVGQSQVSLADIANFRRLSGLPASAPVMQFTGIGVDPGFQQEDIQESSADIEWAGAVAKGATISFIYGDPVNAGGATDAFVYAINHDSAPVISMSYGNCEAEYPPSEVEYFVALAQQANAQGITITSAAGDSGATDCDAAIGDLPATAGLSVDLPASLPYVTGVGGTEFNEGNGTFWKTPTNSDLVTSALSYIPEIAWNNTAVLNQLASTGGGASSLFGKPSWQAGAGVPVDNARDVPDIAVNASRYHDPYLICTELPLPPAALTDPTPSCQNGFHNSFSDSGVVAYGGTTFGASTFGGIVALINQKVNSGGQKTNFSGQGNINYLLYPLARNVPSAFNDITLGSNLQPCAAGSVDCHSTGTLRIGYLACTGYDQTTGLGSFDAFNLVTSWPTAADPAGSAPTLAAISPLFTAAGTPNLILKATGKGFASNAQILWNGSTEGVTMLPGGTSNSISAAISPSLVAYGTGTGITTITGGAIAIRVTSDSANAGEAAPPLPFYITSHPPENDNISSAHLIESSNYTDTVDNSAATTESTDPPLPSSCYVAGAASGNSDTKTVWWQLNEAGTQPSTVTINSLGSSYDTMLSVWTGTPGSLTIAASGGNPVCNDDILPGKIRQSQVSFSAIPGVTYYVMAAPFGPPDTGSDLAGGKTVLNVSGAMPPPAPPSIISAASAVFVAGTLGSFPVLATGSPAPVFSATGGVWPAGVTLDPGTGVIGGVPQTSGSFPVTLAATNRMGSGVQQFTLTVNQVPAFVSANGTQFYVGVGEESVTIKASGVPTPTLSESGNLPVGVTFTPATGILDGSLGVGVGGVYLFQLIASNRVGSDATQNITRTVAQFTNITSAASTTFLAGRPNVFTIKSTGYPAPAFSETGALPDGVTLDPVTGVLSGFPPFGSLPSYPITITARNGVIIYSTQKFTLKVSASAIIVSPTAHTVAAGNSAGYSISDVGTVAYTLACSGLPAGASCGAATASPTVAAYLVISTTSRTSSVPAALSRRRIRFYRWPVVVSLLAASLIPFLAARKRECLAFARLGAIALFIGFAAAGCGLTGGGPVANPNGTPAGTYSITVTGTSAGQPSQTLLLTLTVT